MYKLLKYNGKVWEYVDSFESETVGKESSEYVYTIKLPERKNNG